MSLAIGLRHSLPWIAITDILKMINVIFGERIIPDTKFLLEKYFSPEITSAVYHAYCPHCKKYLGISESIQNLNDCECGFNLKETMSFFVEFNLKDEIKKLLSNKLVIKHLNYRFKRKKKNDEALEDIFDGKNYKRNKYLENELNLSYIFNTDGCQLADTSKVAIWPYYIMINELPPHIRTKYIIPAGLWVDKSQPNMNVFGDIFVKQANELSTVGILWNYRGKDVISKIFPLLSSVDSVARCKMLNMKQFNGLFGCTYCLHPTEQINNSAKYPITENIPLLRSNNDIKELMKKSVTLETATAEGTFGIKGPSFLMNLKYFNLAESLPPDYMHSVLLGLTRQFTEIILTSVNKEYYIGQSHKIDIISDRLLSISPPKIITRTPRSLIERKLWRASEWRSWLLFYSLPCLRGILPNKYLRHWSLFVIAFNILLQDSITHTALGKAKSLLIKFVVKFQSFYGKEAMTYNVHLLLHLCQSVENYGPLWAHNTFPFENANRLLLKNKHSPARIIPQFTKRILLFQNITSFSDKTTISYHVNEFCNSLFETRLKTAVKLYDNSVLVGSGKNCHLTEEEIELLNEPIEKCFSFDKFIYNDVRYTTISYQQQRCKKLNDSIVQLDNGSIGQIHKICLIKSRNVEKVILFVNTFTLKTLNLTFSLIPIEHIKECNVTNSILTVHKPANLVRPCIFMQIDNYQYVSKIPYGCLHD